MTDTSMPAHYNKQAIDERTRDELASMMLQTFMRGLPSPRKMKDAIGG
uniref:Uncharacterized protein n=1 Tax=Candidatus Kentrum sp. MB TaxID=2138164 RepID=A0A450XNA9_9GAMM|nr:MAG: hypothetical protein BECKMB1821G_GA0114241_10702 [Candidatus Kentron sp. MB]VFK36143.1 MAG: hypothetical protein BECKMB1821I_GA0114274_12111 [Candidatus Kentron sp. MB]